MEKLYKPSEVAEVLRLGRLAVYKMVKSGRIGAIRLPNGKLRIPDSELKKVCALTVHASNQAKEVDDAKSPE